MENQIIYLREECNSKNNSANLILENIFKSNILKVTSYTNNNTLLISNDETTIRKVLIAATFMIIDLMLFLLMRTIKITIYANIYTDLHVNESSSKTLHSDGNQNQKHIQPDNRKQRQKKLPVNAILGDSVVKDVK